MSIFKILMDDDSRRVKITEMLLECLDSSLANSSLASEEYFNLLTQLLTSELQTTVPS